MKTGKVLKGNHLVFVIGSEVKNTTEEQKNDVFVFTEKLNNRKIRKGKDPYPVGVIFKSPKDGKMYFHSSDAINIGEETMAILHQFLTKVRLGAFKINEEKNEIEMYDFFEINKSKAKEEKNNG